MRRADAHRVEFTVPPVVRDSFKHGFSLLRYEERRVAQFLIAIGMRREEKFVKRVYGRMRHPPALAEPYLSVLVTAFLDVDSDLMFISLVVYLNPLLDRVFNGTDLFCHYITQLGKRHYKVISSEESITPLSPRRFQLAPHFNRSRVSLRADSAGRSLRSTSLDDGLRKNSLILRALKDKTVRD